MPTAMPTAMGVSPSPSIAWMKFPDKTNRWRGICWRHINYNGWHDNIRWLSNDYRRLLHHDGHGLPWRNRRDDAGLQTHCGHSEQNECLIPCGYEILLGFAADSVRRQHKNPALRGFLIGRRIRRWATRVWRPQTSCLHNDCECQ